MECKMIVCTLPMNDGCVLLVKYRDMPDHQEGWFVPHVLLNEKENPADASTRILKDQFGINDAAPSFSHFESFTGRDGSWHLVFHFKSKLSQRESMTNAQNIATSDWFAPDALPPTGEIAHHGWAADIVERCLA